MILREGGFFLDLFGFKLSECFFKVIVIIVDRILDFYHKSSHDLPSEVANLIFIIEQFNTIMSIAILSYLSARPSVTSAINGVRGVDEQKKTKFGPTYFVCFKYIKLKANSKNIYKPSIALQTLIFFTLDDYHLI